jgi:hypothetical protein
MTPTQDNIVRNLLAAIRSQAEALIHRIEVLESYMRPASPSTPAAPAPDHSRASNTSAAGGVPGANPPALTAPSAPKKRSGLPQPIASAAPAQAAITVGPNHVYVCKDRPGLTYTLDQLVKRTGCSAEQIQMEKPGQNGWRLLAGIYFKRTIIPASAAPLPYESKPRARAGDIGPINAHLIGRAAPCVPQEISTGGAK